jgi:thymidylate synthase (FAD)
MKIALCKLRRFLVPPLGGQNVLMVIVILLYLPLIFKEIYAMKMYLIAMTQLQKGWFDFLKDLKHHDWVGEDEKDPDLLTETAGRLCYNSWAPYKEGEEHLNPNVTKIRVGNKDYLYNILKSGHGSVLEHINFTFLVHGCSRVLTHELVRHRAGMAYSQQSLRYCQLEHLEIVLPIGALPLAFSEERVKQHSEAHEVMHHTVETIRQAVTKLNKLLLTGGRNFMERKQITSYIRRIAPIGVKTNIMFTANARALRHLIQQRTSIHAEVEIRQAFGDIAELAYKNAPNIFQDMIMTGGEFVFKFPKV